MPNIPDSDRSSALSVALVMPNATRRRALVAALAGTQFAPMVHEFGSYPSRDELPAIARLGCQVLIVDLDDDVEQAIHVIENIGRYNAAMTVMACLQQERFSLDAPIHASGRARLSGRAIPSGNRGRSVCPHLLPPDRSEEGRWGRRWFLCHPKAA